MIYLLFRDIEQCKSCFEQININKKLNNNRTWGTVQEIINTSHEDYYDGYRAVIQKPIFINKLSKWLYKCNKYKYIEKEYDERWFKKVKIPLILGDGQ